MNNITITYEKIMSVLCYFISIIIGVVVGYMDYPWYFIFISGLINIFVFGGFFMDAEQKERIKREWFKYLFYVFMVVSSSYLAAIAYLIFKLPSLL